MTTQVEEKKAAVRVAIAKLIEFMDARIVEVFAARYPNLTAPTHALEGGRKYLRIVQEGNGRSVHCFVDAETGGVYKAAGWKAPALNGERYNLLDPESVLALETDWDPYGSYLYKR